MIKDFHRRPPYMLDVLIGLPEIIKIYNFINGRIVKLIIEIYLKELYIYILCI